MKNMRKAIGKNKCTYICPVLHFLYHNLQEGQQGKSVELLHLANTIISMKNKVGLA